MNVIDISVTPSPLPGKLAGNDRVGWAALYRSLEHRQLGVVEVGNYLYQGHAIGPILDGWRSYDHFIRAQHIAIDMDTEDKRSSISRLIDHDLVQMYGAVVYSTPSSTPTAPRTRVLFFLDAPIADPYKYKVAIKTLSAYFPGHDRSSAEATRTFFGNASLAESHNVDGMWIPSDSCLPLADLRAMYKSQQQEAQRTAKPLPDYSKADIDVSRLLKACISKAAHGQRNNIGFWFACRMVENGIPQLEAEQAMQQYAMAVPQPAHDPYTVEEAMQSLRSAQTGVTV